MKQSNQSIQKSAALVLEHHLGKRPKKLKPIRGGLVNQVFEAQVDGEEMILRISSCAERLQFFMKEQWAVNAARRKKVPTPEILEVSNEVIGWPYMISRKVDGQPAGPLGHSRTSVLHELGHYAALINAIPKSYRAIQ